jgi:hypothetical protein
MVGEETTKMEKPFTSELARLTETYDWAMDQDITPLVNFVRGEHLCSRLLSWF